MDRRDKVELFEQILRGHQRVETERLIAFRSHWGFATEFCNPARGNEKGGVESEVGYFRRNHLVPIPKVKDLAELNEHLLRGCREDENRRIAGKPLTVGEAMRLGICCGCQRKGSIWPRAASRRWMARAA